MDKITRYLSCHFLIFSLLFCVNTAFAQEFSRDDQFCLNKDDIYYQACRAYKFPNQTHYTAICPNYDVLGGPNHSILLTDEWKVTAAGESNCPLVETRPHKVLFSQNQLRGGGNLEPANESDDHVQRVLFGTNRQVDFTIDPDRAVFTGERSRKLQLGVVGVSIPSKHDEGFIERPWSFLVQIKKLLGFKNDPDKFFNIRYVNLLDPENFSIQLREAVSAKKSENLKQAFVFIHGFNVNFDDAVFRAAQIAYDMKFDGAPMVYSWPSRGTLSSRGYEYDQQSALGARKHLINFLEFVRAESQADLIHLIAHSMGNDPLLEALSRLNLMYSDQRPLFNEVILAAPDIDVSRFYQLAEEITGAAEGVTLYANEKDRALDISEFNAGSIPRAGDLPPVIVPGIETVDVTAINSAILSLNHSAYADNPLLLKDIQLLFEQRLRPPNERSALVSKKTHEDGVYWQHETP